MVVVDANVLLYAINEDAPNHEPSRAWLDRTTNGEETVGFAWTVLLAFLRLTTRADLFPQPLAAGDAVAAVEAWLERPAAVIVEPTRRHAAVLGGLLREVGTAGNLVGDAHLAALAVEHDARIVSFDADFARFTGVRWERPS